jgi:hypothetical protein
VEDLSSVYHGTAGKALTPVKPTRGLRQATKNRPESAIEGEPRTTGGFSMDVFTQLAETVRRQNREGELPDFIVPLLLKVAESPGEFTGREELIARLVQYVEEYQTWSEMCCEKVGFSLEDIHRTLDQLKVRY